MEYSVTDKSIDSDGISTYEVNSLELTKKKIKTLMFLEFLTLIHMPENNSGLCKKFTPHIQNRGEFISETHLLH
jgi:hypothetical protein